ncbi:MAG: hypothetical protein AAGA21_20785 [Pseudomonadota bacterium]
MRNACLVLTILGLASGAPTASVTAEAPPVADDVIGQIDAGKSYYAEGDLSRALTELEFALNTVRAEFSRQFMATLPEPPVLWSADEPALESSAALFGTGLMVTRRYEEEKGQGRITAELMVDSPMVQAFSAVFSIPVMIANDPSMERIRVGESNAILKWDADRRAGDLSLALGGRVLVKLSAQDVDDKTVLIDLMTSWDLDAVRKVAGIR